MGGMKSGTGDDLWDDDSDDTAEEQPDEQQEQQHDTSDTDADADVTDDGDIGATVDDRRQGSPSKADNERPYVVRRALSNEGTQFERPNRLTFFVQDDVARGESQLEATAEEHFETSIPTFDVREAAYRTAIDNPDLVLDELAKMGYETD